MDIHFSASGIAAWGRARSAWILATVIAVVATCSVTAGLRWSLSFHPDEKVIVRWIAQTCDNGYIDERVYPEGWFTLYRQKARCASRLRSLSRRWTRHLAQEGAVDAMSYSSFRPQPPDSGQTPQSVDMVQEGRNFNAFLFVLSALLLYAACLEAGLRPSAAFVSALFFLASPAPHEFARYCETDTALVFSLCLFAWIAARSLRKLSPWLVLLAAFSAGFAAACKFTLAPLVFWSAILPAVLAAESPSAPRRRVALAVSLVAGALLCAAAGYAFGTPALVADWHWYFASLGKTSARTYAEILKSTGGEPSFRAAAVLRLRGIAEGVSLAGALPLAWGLAAWTFWWRRPLRRQAFGAPLLAAVFVPFAVLCCPFVRRQETLAFTVVLAMGCGVPLEWWLRRRSALPAPRRAERAAAAACAALCAVALAQGAFRCAAMVSCFRQRDTRAEAHNWLKASVRAEASVAFDSYIGKDVLIGRCMEDLPCTGCHAPGLPYFWDGAAPDGAGYYAENVGFEGRLPLRDGQTGAFRPEVSASLRKWRDGATFVIREWAVGNDAVRPEFGQPKIRLHAFARPGDCAFDIPIGYEPPLRVLPDGASLYAATGVPGLGATPSLSLSDGGASIYVEGVGKGRWLVVRTVDGGGPATARVRGLFHPGKLAVPAAGAAAMPLRPSLVERIAAHAVARPSSRVRVHGSGRCLLSVMDAADAARELRLAGNAADALDLLRRSGDRSRPALVEAFLCAKAAGVAPDGDAETAARAALQAADSARVALPEGRRLSASLCGVPLSIADDFSTLRVDIPAVLGGGAFPAYLPKGKYRMCIRLQRTRKPVDLSSGILFEGQEAPLQPVTAPDGTTHWECEIVMRRGGVPRFAVHPKGPDSSRPDLAQPSLVPDGVSAEIELFWNPLERTLDAAEEIRKALQTP